MNMTVLLDTHKEIQLLIDSDFSEQQAEAIVDIVQRAIYANCVRENVGAAEFNRLQEADFPIKQAEALIELIKQAGVIQQQRRKTYNFLYK